MIAEGGAPRNALWAAPTQMVQLAVLLLCSKVLAQKGSALNNSALSLAIIKDHLPDEKFMCKTSLYLPSLTASCPKGVHGSVVS